MEEQVTTNASAKADLKPYVQSSNVPNPASKDVNAAQDDQQPSSEEFSPKISNNGTVHTKLDHSH